MARKIPEVGAICRDLQHAWAPYKGGKLTSESRKHIGWWRELRCSRCGTTRIEAMNKVGDVVKRQYGYPEGYRLEGGGKLTPDERAKLRIQHIKEE